MKRLKPDKLGRVRWLDKYEEKALRDTLDNRQENQRKDRAKYNDWRRQRHVEPLSQLEGVFTDYLKPMVLLALNTGLRRGEIFNLHWPDIDLNDRTLTVQGQTSKSGSTRYIPMNDEVFSVLVTWRNQSASEKLVFPSPATGKRFDNISSSWKNLTADASIKNFNFHDLRHHFASKLVMAGVNLNTVRELLGHSSLEQTLRYAHLDPEHKAKAVALLNKSTNTPN